MGNDVTIVNRSTQLETLAQINTADFVSALGLAHLQRGRRAVEMLCAPSARCFARQVITYDDIVGDASLKAGHEWLLKQFVSRVTVTGLEHIPRTGPLLIVSNHPGFSDGSALLAFTPRTDVRVISANHPFLRALPHTSRHLFYLENTLPCRTRLIRDATRYLRHGGALLLFPAGQIEPDPAFLPGALDALDHWSASTGLFSRLVPTLTIVPAVVSGVHSLASLRHPLVYLRRCPKERQRLAAILQIVRPELHNATVQLTFGQSHQFGSLSSVQATTASALVREDVRRLIEQCSPVC